MTKEVPDGEELFDLITSKYKEAIELTNQLWDVGEDIFDIADGKNREPVSKTQAEFYSLLLEARGKLCSARERVIRAYIKRGRNTFGKWSMVMRNNQELEKEMNRIINFDAELNGDIDEKGNYVEPDKEEDLVKLALSRKLPEEKEMTNMTVEDALITIATYTGDVTHQSDLFVANKVLDETNNSFNIQKYGAFELEEGKKSFSIIQSNTTKDWYCSLDCEFVYKRSVEGRMLPVGIRDKTTGTVVLMYLESEEKKDNTYVPALFYPEFYIYVGEKERKSINCSAYYWHYPPNYVQVEAKTIEFLQEIKVKGEGKDVFVIGFTSPTSNEEDKVYLYKTKVID